MITVYQIINSVYEHPLDDYPTDTSVKMTYSTKEDAIVFLHAWRYYYEQHDTVYRARFDNDKCDSVTIEGVNCVGKIRLSINEYPIYESIAEAVHQLPKNNSNLT